MAIVSVVSAPNWRSHFSISHAGADSSVARSGQAMRLAIHLSEDGVHQAGRGPLASALDQLDAFADGGVRRDSIQIAKLVDAHAQSDADFGIERARDEAADQMIELGLIAKASEDDFGSQPGIAGVELGGVFEQQVGRVAALAWTLRRTSNATWRARESKANSTSFSFLVWPW